MFRNIETRVYENICDMLFERYFVMITSVKQLEGLFNRPSTPSTMKEDIMTIYLNYYYICDFDLNKLHF